MFPKDLLALARSVLQAARANGLRIATAESCTGGLIAALLTETPGASDVFECGFVTYSNAAKCKQLGIPRSLLEAHGAVSEAVARAMADGALAHSRADLAVAVTGIAGPRGGSEQKRVGLVHLAGATKLGVRVHEEHRFGGIGRGSVRMKAVESALRLLIRALVSPTDPAS